MCPLGILARRHVSSLSSHSSCSLELNVESSEAAGQNSASQHSLCDGIHWSGSGDAQSWDHLHEQALTKLDDGSNVLSTRHDAHVILALGTVGISGNTA